MTDDRDPVLERAIGFVDPVPPGPGFWEELEARLHDEQGAPVLELARVAGGRRGLSQAERRRRLGLGTTAVAAAALLAFGLVALTGDDGQDRGRTTPPVDQPDGATTTVVPGPGANPGEVVAYATGRWIEAAAAADADAAWALLGPQSRETLGSAQQLAGISSTSSLFSWGQLRGRPDRDRTVVPLSEDGLDQLVVFDPVGDGLPMALAVIDAGSVDTARVEAYLPGRSLGLIGLTPGATVAPADVLPVSVDADAAGYAAVLDSSQVPAQWERRDDDGALVGIQPLQPLGAGRHWLAIAMRTPGDALALDVVVFQSTG